jgi:hypothetical protein
LSTLTKIIVVLLVVFCIAFTMSSISFVAQTNEWRALAEAYQQEAHASDTAVRNVLASSAAQMAMDRDAINAHIQRIQNLEGELQDDQQEIADRKAELAQSRAQVAGLDGTVRTLTGELKVGQTGWTQQRQQREQLEQRNIELEKRNLDLNERVNEQTAQLLVLRQQQRQLEQQIHMLRSQPAAGPMAGTEATLTPAGVAGPDAVTAVSPVAVSPIHGRITDVSGALATISVGSADGVQEGMVFVIYRGLDYIGDLKVGVVEPNQAAGRLIRSAGSPRVGDQVADEARFGMAK